MTKKLDNTIDLDTISEILFGNVEIEIAESVKKEMTDNFRFLREFAEKNIVYGINTGFGPMAQYFINNQSLIQLQYNLIRSHSTGAGNPLPPLYVRAAMIARLGTFFQARSGIDLSLAELIVQFINKGIYPMIPEHGGVGASGDLVQLAHLALALIGEGKVLYNGEWRDSGDVFRETGLQPFKVRLREGLSVTNGTSVMTGIGLVNLIYSKKLLNWATSASVIINEISSSYGDFMSMELNSVRRHTGQNEIARLMREQIAGSRCIRVRYDNQENNNGGEEVFAHKVQPYYSLRCVPQVLGPVYDEIENAGNILINEVNSACDNPIIDHESGSVFHGGNFHGDYVSFEMDKLKIAITKLTMLVERQLNYLMHNRINEILPPFVNLGVLGLNYGMQACQFTATSTTAECQTLSNPVYVHSIPNNNDNQDIVSMGTNSALMAKSVIENSFQVLAIHFIALCQAVDYLKIREKLSPPSQNIYARVRKLVPTFIEDSPKYREIELIIDFLKTN